jgi:Tn3 transposase DDE domain
MLSLHLLQISLVYINTLMIQQVLSEPAWSGRLNAQDLRGITPLLYGHVNPYGAFFSTCTHACLSIRLDLALGLSAPKCCSATINSPDDGYFAARDSKVGFRPCPEH